MYFDVVLWFMLWLVIRVGAAILVVLVRVRVVARLGMCLIEGDLL